MTKRKTRKASWLLTVASAYSVLPGCSDDPAAAKPDSSMESHDGGGTVTSPHQSDAAATQGSGTEAGAGASAEIDAGEEIDFPTLIGVIVFPPGNRDLPELDAGSTDAPPAEDAGAEDDAHFITGLVALPPDGSADDRVATGGDLDRPLPKTPWA